MIEAHPHRTESGRMMVAVIVNGGEPILMTPDQANTVAIHDAGQYQSEHGRAVLHRVSDLVCDLRDVMIDMRIDGHHECSVERAVVLAGALMEVDVLVELQRRGMGLAWLVLAVGPS